VYDPAADHLARLWKQEGQNGIVPALVGRGGLFAASYVADEQAAARLEQLVAARSA
jgi:hypothetical protein